MAATLFPRDIVCLRNISINTLHKGDDDDDDYDDKDLTVEIQHVWNIKTNVIPVIIGATGTISISSRKYPSNIPGKHEIKEVQGGSNMTGTNCDLFTHKYSQSYLNHLVHKTAILGTAHILREVLI
jgi:hypothetical protein